MSIQRGSSREPHLCFGTYRLNGLILKDAADQAMNEFRKRKRPQLIDGAFKYQNLDTLTEILDKYPQAKLGYKVEFGRKNASVETQLESLRMKITDSSRVFRILLHNYSGKKAYLAFQQMVKNMFGEEMPIGVCNITKEELKDLIEGETPAQINFVQNEFHPFLETDVPALCKELGIWFEAHSTLTGMDQYKVVLENSNYYEMNGCSTKVSDLSEKPAQLAIGFSAKYSDSVCFSTQNYVHLVEILNSKMLDPDTLSLMNNMKNFHPRIARYKGASSKACTGKVLDRLAQTPADHLEEALEIAKKEILPDLLKAFSIYFKGDIPSNILLLSLEGLPKWYRKPLPGFLHPHDILAQALYLDPHQEGSTDCTMTALFGEKPVSNFEKIEKAEQRPSERLASANQKLDQLLRKVRHCIITDEQASKAATKVAPNQDVAVTQPSALPVDSYPPASEFEDLLQFLRTGGIHEESNIRFQHGTINADGRLDLCKQGIKNAFIESCEAVVDDRNPPNTRIQYGTTNADGRLDLCKQGIKNAFIKSCEAVAEEGNPSNIRFQHGTINADGQLDLCKQGIKNAFIESCEAVAENGNPANTRFQHGTINADGRLDLCKQGIKNAFLETCKAIVKDLPSKRKPLIKHYLFGNNRIAENLDGKALERVSALCDMIRRRPDIETWFLAGNEFGPEEIKQVAEAMKEVQAKFLWFKMNPLKTGAYYLGRLAMINPNVELLDMMNCGLCNEGIKAFLQGLKDGFRERNQQLDEDLGIDSRSEEMSMENFTNLKHLYININSIDENACMDLKELFELLGDKLESLYINMNRFGDKGIEKLFGTSKNSSNRPLFPHLQRLSLGSLGLTDASLPILITFTRMQCPSLVSIDFSTYKSTTYFGEEHNKFTTRSFELLVSLARLLKRNSIKARKPDFAFLGFEHCFAHAKHLGIKNTEDAKAFLAFLNSLTSLGLSINAIQIKTHDMTSLDESPFGMLVRNPKISMKELRTVTHPVPAVDYIDSIYRNTMK